MGTFTLELREVLELTGAEISHEGSRTIVRNSGIHLEHYPLFNESYRDTLNGLIVDRFYTREIAHETIDMFRLRLRAHMNENMPYFNELYLTKLTDINPLKTVDIRTVSFSESENTSENTSEGSANNTSTSAARTVSSDTPQTRLNGSEDYASAMTDANSENGATSNTSENGSQSVTGEQNSDTHQSGYSGAPGDLITSFRQSILNVDMMVLESLEDLFMTIWNNDDTYTSRRGISTW